MIGAALSLDMPETGEQTMKWLKRIGWIVLSLPVILVIVFILYEALGMFVNHNATRQQTDTLQTCLENEIPDIEIIHVYTETGNTSGTGNHVDCLSSITFSTGLTQYEIEEIMEDYYVLDGWDCYLKETEEGYFLFYLNTPAPFADNIEGR